MNPLTLILLAFFAYFFYSIGSTFLAFLSITVAIIFAISSPKAESAGSPGQAVYRGGGGQQPIIVQAGGGHAPAAFPRKFEFRPNFPGDPDGDEWISSRIGLWIVMFFRMIKRVFGSSESKSDGRH
ncbi:MAG: hypothetical protein AABX01_03720 [Candidatus Micrarchaeota archaeon]